MTKLRPRARIIRTIGDQLISGPEAAIIELVKNAFDADSRSVWVTIVPKSAEVPLGRISVRDTGHGMTYNDVVNRWFEPATEEKLRRQFSPGGRRLLGAKGIGRFAAARLGTRTKVTTISRTKAGKIDHVVVDVDWDRFNSDSYLDELDVPVTRKVLPPSADSRTGVTLDIEDLRDVWTRKRVEGLIRELRRLAAPTVDGDKFDIHLDLSAFNDVQNGFEGPALMREMNADLLSSDHVLDHVDPSLIVPFRTQDYADYQLRGDFDAEGGFTGWFTIVKGDNQPKVLNVPAPVMLPDEEQCGPVSVSINVYDRENESIQQLFQRMGLNFETIGVRAARKILTDNAGIAIFRNGFRIRPYGEPENDWLELEAQRVQNPSKKLGLTQVSGRVTIAEESKSHLIERSSREGLEHNGALARLKRLLSVVLLHVEERRLAFRQHAGLSRRADGDIAQVKTLANLDNVSRAVASLPASQQPTLLTAVDRDKRALAASLEELEAYQQLLQSRAALGLVVARVIHEGRRFLNPLAVAARLLGEQQHSLLKDSPTGKVARAQLPGHLEIISTSAKGLGRLFKQLDPISGRRRGRPTNFSVADVVSTAMELLNDQIQSAAIQVLSDVPAALNAYGYSEDFQAAVLNVLDNAIYWTGTSDGPRRIEVSTLHKDDAVRVAVSNTGPTIDEQYVPRLFTAGFSLKTEGTGLGLAIAREACRASRGDLFFDPNAADTTFVIEFPRMRAEE